MTLPALTPHVTRLMNPSGGWGLQDALDFQNPSQLNVYALGIEFPLTILPPGRVTCIISSATSNGLGANMAPKMLMTRLMFVLESEKISGITFLKLESF